jgi:hypothetical protein
MMPDMSSSTCLRCPMWWKKDVKRMDHEVTSPKTSSGTQKDIVSECWFQRLNRTQPWLNHFTHGNSRSKDDHVPAPPCAWDIAMKVQLLETALKLQPGNAIGILRPAPGQGPCRMSDQGPFFELTIPSNQKKTYDCETILIRITIIIVIYHSIKSPFSLSKSPLFS